MKNENDSIKLRKLAINDDDNLWKRSFAPSLSIFDNRNLKLGRGCSKIADYDELDLRYADENIKISADASITERKQFQALLLVIKLAKLRKKKLNRETNCFRVWQHENLVN